MNSFVWCSRRKAVVTASAPESIAA